MSARDPDAVCSVCDWKHSHHVCRSCGVAGLQIALMVAVAAGLSGALCFWRSLCHYAADFTKIADCIIEAEK